MKSARVSYWWVFNSAGLVLITAVLALLIYFLLEGALELNDSSALLKIMCGITFATLIVSIPKVFVKSLFQQGGFLIGLQIKRTKKRIKIRNYILSSILVTLVLGVISGIIVHYLFP